MVSVGERRLDWLSDFVLKPVRGKASSTRTARLAAARVTKSPLSFLPASGGAANRRN